MKEYIEKLTMRECCIDEDGQTDEPIIKKLNEVIDFINSADVAPVRYGSIIETIEDGHMKRTFSCCGTDFTKMTCWMTPKYCPECGAIINGGKLNET